VEIGSLSLEAIAGEGVKQGKKDKIVVFMCVQFLCFRY